MLQWGLCGPIDAQHVRAVEKSLPPYPTVLTSSNSNMLLQHSVLLPQLSLQMLAVVTTVVSEMQAFLSSSSTLILLLSYQK